MKHHNTSYTPLYPLFLGGIILILVLFVIRQYVQTAGMQPTIILPAGHTYLGE